MLLIACCGNEFFLVALYVAKFTAGPAIAFAGGLPLVHLIAYVNFPIFVFKQVRALLASWPPHRSPLSRPVAHRSLSLPPLPDGL